MIRIIPFEPKYTEQMLEVARQIHERSIYSDLEFDEPKVIRQLDAAGNIAPDRFLRLAVDGEERVVAAIFGQVTRTFFSAASIASDIGQWTRGDRTQLNSYWLLVATFEEWARGQGAQKICLGHHSGIGDIEVTRRIFEFQGYRVTGYNTVKDL